MQRTPQLTGRLKDKPQGNINPEEGTQNGGLNDLYETHGDGNLYGPSGALRS